MPEEKELKDALEGGRVMQHLGCEQEKSSDYDCEQESPKKNTGFEKLAKTLEEAFEFIALTLVELDERLHALEVEVYGKQKTTDN